MKKHVIALIAAVLLPTLALAADTTQISAITKDKVDQTVTISGTITSFTPARSDRAPNSFKLKDTTGEIRVAVWKDVFDKLPQKDQLKQGAQATVEGKVAEFKGALEIHVENENGVKIGGAAAAGATTGAQTQAAPAAAAKATSAPASASSVGVVPISSITADKQGSKVTVKGKVESARKIKGETGPFIIKVSDGTGSIDVVFWQDLADKLSPGQKVNTGDKIQVAGEVNSHRGTLQLKVGTPSDIQTEKTDPALFSGSSETSGTKPQASARKVGLGEIASAQLHERVAVDGHVAAVQPIRTGRRVTLEGNGAKADVLLWDTAEGLKPEVHTLASSNSLSVQGSIEEANGQRVLVVSKPEEVISVQR